MLWSPFTNISSGWERVLLDKRGTATVGSGVYLVIRVSLCHTGLDVTHEGVDEATAVSHCMPPTLLGTAQVPTHIIQSFIYVSVSICVETLTCLEHNNRHRTVGRSGAEVSKA